MRPAGLAVSPALLLLFSAAVLLSAAVPAAMAKHQTGHEEEEFGYSPDAENGPARWGEIKPEWAACGKGRMQSPIDLSSSRVSLARSLGHLNHSYRPAQATIVNSGHDVMVRIDGDAGSVSIDDTAYNLQQLHWHWPAEHTVDGRRHDMELHMVHQSAHNKTAVVAVHYQIGAHDDAFLHKLEPYIAMIAGQKDREEKVGVVDPMGARGRASVYYRYVGSLTAPPCTEGVIWTILKRVRTVSKHQLQLLREAVHDEMDNARPSQEMNNRDVSIFRPYGQNKN
uniref:Uncharacterized protein n=1 Tax=Avena sativa TaxID=4498 RepID=A0ACD5ZT49_AVESA